MKLYALPQEARAEVEDRVAQASRLHLSFLVLTVLSTIIATYGLLANSPAVVIGAMLVAPLMMPIFGLSLGTVTSSQRLFSLALRSLALGVVVCIGTALTAARLVPELEFGSEILGRTRPNLLDLAVAVAAGLVGAYSVVRTDISSTLTGVAIATALVPPLSVVGVELGAGDYRSAAGALLLFTANLLAIYLAGAVVFTLKGFADLRTGLSMTTLTRRYGISAAAFLIVGAVLTQALMGMARDQHQRRTVREVLTRQAGMVKGATLESFTLQRSSQPLEVAAVMRTPASFDPPKVAAIQNVLEAELGSPVRLLLRSVISKDANAERYLGTEPEGREDTLGREGLQSIEQVLRAQAAAVPDSSLSSWQVTPGPEGYRVRAVYVSDAPFSPSLVRGMENLLEGMLNSKVRLEVETVPPPEPRLETLPQERRGPESQGERSVP